MKIKYTKASIKAINSLDRSMKLKIKSGIEGLNEEPPKGELKRCRVLIHHSTVYE